MTRRPDSRIVVQRSRRNHDSSELINLTRHRAAAGPTEDVAEAFSGGESIGNQQLLAASPAEVFGLHKDVWGERGAALFAASRTMAVAKIERAASLERHATTK